MKLNRKEKFLYILSLASSLLLSSRCQEKQKYFRNISKTDWPFEKHSQAFWLKIPPTIKVMKALRSLKNAYTELNLSWRRSLSSRNQSTNLLRKLIDWFLYDIPPSWKSWTDVNDLNDIFNNKREPFSAYIRSSFQIDNTVTQTMLEICSNSDKIRQAGVYDVFLDLYC